MDVINQYSDCYKNKCEGCKCGTCIKFEDCENKKCAFCKKRGYYTFSPYIPSTQWGGSTSQGPPSNPCDSCSWPKELKEKYHGTYVGDAPCQWCPHGNRFTC